MSNLRKKKRQKGKHKKNKFAVFTDGSANGNGWGAWVALIYKGNQLIGYCAGTNPDNPTSQFAELSAIRLAVLELNNHDVDQVTFHSDSTYALGVLQNRKWRLKANKEIIQEMRYFIDKLEADVIYQHVPRDTPHIELCHKYANIFRKKEKKISYVKYCKA